MLNFQSISKTILFKLICINNPFRSYPGPQDVLITRTIPRIGINNVLNFSSVNARNLRIPEPRCLTRVYNYPPNTPFIQKCLGFGINLGYRSSIIKDLNKVISKNEISSKKQIAEEIAQINISYKIDPNNIQLLKIILLDLEKNLINNNFNIKFVQDYIEFILKNPSLQFFVDYKNIIIPINECLKKNKNSNEDFKLLENLLKQYLEHKKSIFLIENYDKKILISENETMKQKDLKQFLNKHLFDRCFLKHDFKNNNDIICEGLLLLDKYKGELIDQEFIDILVHLNICHYEHVYYMEGNEFNSFYNSGALKIDKIAFKHYVLDVEQISTEKISEEDFKIIKEKISNKDFEIGTLNINREMPNNTLFLSAHDLHLNVTVSIKGSRYIVGFFTSAIDDNTEILSLRQEINDGPKEQNKYQMFRAGNRLIKIDDKDFIVDKKATDYAKDFSRDPDNIAKEGKVSDRIFNSIKKQEQNLQYNPIGIPYVFTKDNLPEIVKKLLFDFLTKLEQEKAQKFKKEHNDRTDKKRDLAERQKKNYLNTEQEVKFRQSLSQFDRFLYDIAHTLKKKHITKSSEKSILDEPNMNKNIQHFSNIYDV